VTVVTVVASSHRLVQLKVVVLVERDMERDADPRWSISSACISYCTLEIVVRHRKLTKQQDATELNDSADKNDEDQVASQLVIRGSPTDEPTRRCFRNLVFSTQRESELGRKLSVKARSNLPNEGCHRNVQLKISW